MTEAPSSDEYDRVTSDRSEIREWVETWDGQPATTGTGTERDELTIDFDGTDADSVSWDEFFDRLDSASLALAYRTGDPDSDDTPPAYEFVRRVDTTETSETEGGPDTPEDDIGTEPDEAVADRRSRVREREAETQENPDNHRDREPFQS